MVADAVHSFSDLATDVVVIAFARISAKPRDDGHDYGHGKYETLATIIISLALGIVGAGILAGSIRDIRIVVDGGRVRVCIRGTNLQLVAMDSTALLISGTIACAEFA